MRFSFLGVLLVFLALLPGSALRAEETLSSKPSKNELRNLFDGVVALAQKKQREDTKEEMLLEEHQDAFEGVLSVSLDAFEQGKPFLAVNRLRSFWKSHARQLFADSRIKNPEGFTTYVPVAGPLLSWLAAEGLDLTHLLNEKEKEELPFAFERALATKDEEALGQLADRLLLFPQGRQLLAKLTPHFRVQGQSVLSEFWIRLLLSLESKEEAAQNQLLWQELIMAQFMQGKREEALRSLAIYEKRFPKGVFAHQGKTVAFAPYIYAQWAKKNPASNPAALVKRRISQYQGDPHQRALAADPGPKVPAGTPAWSFTFSSEAHDPSNRRRFILQGKLRELRLQAPNVYPLILDRHVILYDGHTVHLLDTHAIDAKGQIKATQPFEPRKADTPWTPESANRFVRDLALTSAQGLLFTPMLPYLSAEEKGHPSLACWKLGTPGQLAQGVLQNALQWQASAQANTAAGALLSQISLAPSATPAGGRLYCPAVQNYQDGIKSTLVCLDQNSGAFRWQSSCGYRLKVVGAFRLTIRGRAYERDPLQHTGWTAAHHGAVFFSSQLGVLSAVSAADGRRLWSVRYPSLLDTKQGQVAVAFQNGTLISKPPYLFAAPRDGSHVFAIDARTGRVIWTFSPETSEEDEEELPNGLVQVLGVVSDYLYLTSGRDVIRVHLSASIHREKPAFETVKLPEGARAAGQGLLTPHHIFVPTRTGIWRVSVSSFNRAQKYAPWPEGQKPGNLLTDGNFLFVTTRHKMCAYPWTAKKKPAPKTPATPSKPTK